MTLKDQANRLALCLETALKHLPENSNVRKQCQEELQSYQEQCQEVWVKRARAVELLGVSARSLQSWRDQCRLKPAIHYRRTPGGTCLYNVSEIQRFMERSAITR